MNRISVTLTSVLCAFSGQMVLADGIRFELDLTTENSTLTLWSENENAGYSAGRGILFRADEPIIINGAELWTKSLTGLNATFELWENVRTEGDGILENATLVRSATNLLIGDLGFHGAKFEDFTLTVDQTYLIRVLYEEPADENWFFDFDRKSDPPLDLGPVTVIDGTLRENTFNFAAPFMTLQIVPAPGAIALLALAGIACGRRRRR